MAIPSHGSVPRGHMSMPVHLAEAGEGGPCFLTMQTISARGPCSVFSVRSPLGVTQYAGPGSLHVPFAGAAAPWEPGPGRVCRCLYVRHVAGRASVCHTEGRRLLQPRAAPWPHPGQDHLAPAPWGPPGPPRTPSWLGLGSPIYIHSNFPAEPPESPIPTPEASPSMFREGA